MANRHQLMIERANMSVDKMKDAVRKSRYRQRYHFMAPAYWMNDPNGLIQYKGKYHLFYQHNPYAPSWGSMHWGHAVSLDLVHWEHLPITLAPSEEYDEYEHGGCWSGSAVEDDDTLYVFYTGVARHNDKVVQSQCLAISYDGIHFEKYKDNPIIKGPPEVGSPDFRDPKVWKYNDAWYMVVGSCRDGKGKALLYKSCNLRDWQYVNVVAESFGELGSMWECPDLFPLQDKHVLMFSAIDLGERKTIYLVGDMDYKTGKLFWSSMGEVDWGFDFYAMQSLLDNKGRRILMGWANNWRLKAVPTVLDNWCGSLSLPRVVSLCSDGRLRFEPIEELTTLREDCIIISDVVIKEGSSLKIGSEISYEIIADFNLTKSNTSSFGFALRCSEEEKTLVECNLSLGELIFDRTHSDRWTGGTRRCPLESAGKDSIRLHIFVDTCSVEVFTDNGRTVMSCNIYPSERSTDIYIYSRDGSVYLKKLYLWRIKSIW